MKIMSVLRDGNNHCQLFAEMEVCSEKQTQLLAKE